MAGNQHQQPAVGAAHPTTSSTSAKGTSKYTNKDGSKFITVPKAGSSSTDSAQPSPSLPPTDGKTATSSGPAGAGSPTSAQPVNRKKAKRRAKAAAKALAEQAVNKENPPSPTDSAAPSHDRRSLDVEHDFSEAEDEHLATPDQRRPQENGVGETAKSKKSKKKKKKAAGAGGEDSHNHNEYQEDHDEHDDHDHHHVHHHDHAHNHAPQPPPAHRSSGISKEKIWNTSSQEERERIKEFWLGLGEEERKSLVKVEKDAVLKKMKEQQKHTCSCSVCGRKRTAIEEELEGLYDAYYEELEQYAHQPNQNGEGPPMMGPPINSGAVGNTHSRVAESRGPPSNYPHQPSHGRIVEHVGDDEDEEGDEDYSEEEPDEDDAYSEDDPSEANHHNEYKDFLAFGKSLTVQGGILTVADDLLKNDGRKFIEMMEQLAERRMQREEDAKAYARNYAHANGGAYGHNHPPLEEEEYDEEEEEEYDEEDDEEYDSQEEEDAMTEQQRMEEGRKMFQIFAARMFEQRVLTAYKEKVAKERQQKLIEEIEEESRSKDQRKAKKAKEAQKRKDKAAKRKEALAEEKARKEAEKAAEEAARLAEEARKAEEQRQRAEEKRKKREAQKKAEEEERLRKEAERQRRIHEQKEKQAEQERKAREAKEREKKAKEDAARQREKEAKERKEQDARERKEEQEREKKEKEAKAQAEREARDKLVQEQQKVLQKIQKDAQPVAQKPATALPSATPITLPKRPAQHAKPTAAVPALPQQPASSAAAVASPQITIATPALPKAPAAMRNRQPSQQEISIGSSQPTSRSESNTSQSASPHPLTPSHTSPGPVGLAGKGRSASAQGGAQQPSQTASPLNVPARTAMPAHFGGFAPSPMPLYGQAQPVVHSNPPPGLPSPLHQSQSFPGQIFGGSFGNPGMPPMGANMNRPPATRGYGYPLPPPGLNPPMEPPFPGMGQGFQAGPPRESVSLHHRQSSGGFEQSPPISSAQPIGRPMPIGRPPSVTPAQRPAGSLPTSSIWGGNDSESHRLGSSALLDNSEEANQEFAPPARRNTSIAAHGMPFPNMLGMDPGYNVNNPWAPQAVGQQSQFGSTPPPPGFQTQLQPAPWGTPGQTSSAFAPQNGMGRHGQPRPGAIRQLLCQACKDLAGSSEIPAEERLRDGYVSLRAIKTWMDTLTPYGPTTEKELAEISETLGNQANGGGAFDMQTVDGKNFIRWVPEPAGRDGHPLRQPAIGAPGEIGSPLVGSSTFAFGGGQRAS